MAISVNDSNFEEIVLKAEIPVLVDFWAEWCGPCNMMLPIVEEVSEEYKGRLLVCKLDVDSSPNISGRYGIRNIPTMLLLKNGEVVDKMVGAAPKSSLLDKIETVLGK